MGYRIKTIREQLGMTQVQLAQKSGISRTTIWALENGTDKVTTTQTLKKLADAMNVTVDDLFATDDTRSA